MSPAAMMILLFGSGVGVGLGVGLGVRVGVGLGVGADGPLGSIVSTSWGGAAPSREEKSTPSLVLWARTNVRTP
jgi:hypothetical protein